MESLYSIIGERRKTDVKKFLVDEMAEFLETECTKSEAKAMACEMLEDDIVLECCCRHEMVEYVHVNAIYPQLYSQLEGCQFPHSDSRYIPIVKVEIAGKRDICIKALPLKLNLVERMVPNRGCSHSSGEEYKEYYHALDEAIEKSRLFISKLKECFPLETHYFTQEQYDILQSPLGQRAVAKYMDGLDTYDFLQISDGLDGIMRNLGAMNS